LAPWDVKTSSPFCWFSRSPVSTPRSCPFLPVFSTVLEALSQVYLCHLPPPLFFLPQVTTCLFNLWTADPQRTQFFLFIRLSKLRHVLPGLAICARFPGTRRDTDPSFHFIRRGFLPVPRLMLAGPEDSPPLFFFFTFPLTSIISCTVAVWQESIKISFFSRPPEPFFLIQSRSCLCFQRLHWIVFFCHYICLGPPPQSFFLPPGVLFLTGCTFICPLFC